MSARSHSGRKTSVPLVVFAGRSNVGKSSTIRALTGKKVRIGKKPGSTRWKFEIDLKSVIFVDFPGFGYMKGRSKEDIERTKDWIVSVLEELSGRIVLAVLVIDISLFRELFERWDARDEIPIDVEFYSFLSEIAPSVLVVANKIDKLRARARSDEIAYLEEKLLEAVPSKRPIIIPTSAVKKEGTDMIRSFIDSTLAKRGVEPPDWGAI